MKKKKQFSRIGDVLARFDKNDDTDKYVSREFQKYGYDLAMELGDSKNISMFIKIAKEYPRGMVESARNFVKDAENVKSKTALFLWKLKKLKEEGGEKKRAKDE